MSELLVIAIDRHHPDPYVDCQVYKRGDVVVALPDGWGWGTEEVGNPLFTILRVPDLPLPEAEALCAMERDVDPTHPSRVLQKRAFKLNLEALPATPTVADIRAARAQKPALTDPAILGAPTTVIG